MIAGLFTFCFSIRMGLFPPADSQQTGFLLYTLYSAARCLKADPLSDCIAKTFAASEPLFPSSGHRSRATTDHPTARLIGSGQMIYGEVT